MFGTYKPEEEIEFCPYEGTSEEQMNQLWDELENQFYCFIQRWGYIKEPTKEAWKEYNFSIHNLEEQNLIKRLWSVCAIEELAEFVEAKKDGPGHEREELCDFFNFFCSGLIAMGYNWKDVNLHPFPAMHFWGNNTWVGLMDLWGITETVHLAMNKLKNRPWTDSFFKVDLLKFELLVKKVTKLVQRILTDYFGSWQDFQYEVRKKIEINKRRMESGY